VLIHVIPHQMVCHLSGLTVFRASLMARGPDTELLPNRWLFDFVLRSCPRLMRLLLFPLSNMLRRSHLYLFRLVLRMEWVPSGVSTWINDAGRSCGPDTLSTEIKATILDSWDSTSSLERTQGIQEGIIPERKS
jgi:hypothetical protein